ncbi:glycosyltransferase involved in cell wall biosynthesis [Conyzicola lurida]|uniref:Glycosyltransferase involved in cell wall biosynthesis n=1 Tax=Conyzicola lurida TaxID=1172621 RepID=A0A841ATJ2_9MICO|nr:glycosyltransferase [Conyzicola lurida]MBB5845111.1 glycosyltransferase involved in cell wall biosynthesis [Conyzicola lurida]
MKIVIDVSGAPERSGGMKVHATELVRAWSESYPTDELIVVGPAWVETGFAAEKNVTPRAITRDGVPSRFFTQLFAARQIFRSTKADALLSLSSIVSPFVSSSSTACFVHDWRHITEPGEMGLAQRAYRRLWIWSIRSAGTTFAVSEKTREETLRFSKPQRLILAENGGDHPRRWPQIARTERERPRLVTFGHFINKRPELVIESLAELRTSGRPMDLVVVGAKGDYADELRALAERLGVSDLLTLPGFVPDAELHGLMQNADVVILASTDEGYGFPVVEASYFGVPVVVAADSGIEDIHGSRVVVGPATAAGLAGAVTAALGQKPVEGDAPPIVAWAETAAVVRRALLTAEHGN